MAGTSFGPTPEARIENEKRKPMTVASEAMGSLDDVVVDDDDDHTTIHYNSNSSPVALPGSPPVLISPILTRDQGIGQPEARSENRRRLQSQSDLSSNELRIVSLKPKQEY